MTAPVPWTVVSHTADDSAPAVSVSYLMAWLETQPSIDLHTVLWSAGPRGKAPYDFGRLANVAKAHQRMSARVARRAGLPQLGGGLAARGVRAALRRLPTEGVLYLSTSRSGAVLRYLPPGRRFVVTHLHAYDRTDDRPLTPDALARLIDATDLWLATDEATREWATKTWGIDADDVVIVPEPLEFSERNRATRLSDPSHLRLGIRGAAWFRRDHAARVAQRLLKVRPDLRLDLVFAEVIGDADHLAPLTHDLERLGIPERLELPRSADEVEAALDDIDVLVLTAPDDESPWPVWLGLQRNVPVVCFDTSRVAAVIEPGQGVVVPYLDIIAMADAVLAIHDEKFTTGGGTVLSHRSQILRRDVNVVGPRLLALVGTNTS